MADNKPLPCGSGGKPLWEGGMAWKTPKVVEVRVGLEINSYASAEL